MQASLGKTSLRLEAALREEAGATRWGPPLHRLCLSVLLMALLKVVEELDTLQLIYLV